MGNNPSHFKGPELPEKNGSWDNCKAFMAMLREKAPGLDFRLPTEAQWEYACRAGTATAYSFGDADGLLGEYAWYLGNAGKTHEVGGLKPNAWGLYDLHGNAWEWCLDRYGSYASGDAIDRAGASLGSSRVLCGGGWNDYVDFCRSAANAGITPDAQLDDIGFRAVATPPRSVK